MPAPVTTKLGLCWLRVHFGDGDGGDGAAGVGVRVARVRVYCEYVRTHVAHVCCVWPQAYLPACPRGHPWVAQNDSRVSVYLPGEQIQQITPTRLYPVAVGAATPSPTPTGETARSTCLHWRRSR